MNLKTVILKPGKDKPIRNRHHWIFSGAVEKYPSFRDGDILSVQNANGEILGSGYFNRKSQIVGRLISFGEMPPLESLRKQLDEAIALRAFLFSGNTTTAYRVINAEGDLIPGLIVDRYGDLFVFQISTLGMERLREWLVDYFKEKFHPIGIYEKSIQTSRQEEGLKPIQQLLYGQCPDTISITENNIKFNVSVTEGQKTGFFLDHREMRKWVQSLASGKRVLNAFAYTGGFSVYAWAGGAIKVDSIDISEKAMEFAKVHAGLNGFHPKENHFFVGDAFTFLRENPLPYDLVILDPPAFAKQKKDIISACRGYKELNRLAMQKMPSKSLLLTASCSYHVDKALFQKVLFQASIEAKRTVRIIGHHRLAPDHPINLCHPETDYLKSYLLYIE